MILAGLAAIGTALLGGVARLRVFSFDAHYMPLDGCGLVRPTSVSFSFWSLWTFGFSLVCPGLSSGVAGLLCGSGCRAFFFLSLASFPLSPLLCSAFSPFSESCVCVL